MDDLRDELLRRLERLSRRQRSVLARRLRAAAGSAAAPGDGARRDAARGDAAPEDQARGDAARGHMARRDAARGDDATPAVRPPAPAARLVAYVVPGGDALPPASELREFLARDLPEHMIPAVFVPLEALPRGPTGKVDRGALPDPQRDVLDADAPFVAASTPDELALAGIWSEVLGVDRVGVHDSFFEIGGHSLLAVQLLGRIRETFGVDLPMEVLFEAPTIAATLARIETLRWAREPVVEKADEQEEIEL